MLAMCTVCAQSLMCAECLALGLGMDFKLGASSKLGPGLSKQPASTQTRQMICLGSRMARTLECGFGGRGVLCRH